VLSKRWSRTVGQSERVLLVLNTTCLSSERRFELQFPRLNTTRDGLSGSRRDDLRRLNIVSAANLPFLNVGLESIMKNVSMYRNNFVIIS
jgi:hypothetical protein